MRQHQAHNCKTPIEGHCEWSGCGYRGEVHINSDYEYYCPTHRRQYLAFHFMKSRQGTARHNAVTIIGLRKKLAEAEEKQPRLETAAKQAEFKYNLLVGK